MAYSKTNWQNGVTPINETNLNKVEQGIYDLGQTVNVQTAGTDLNDYVDNGVYFFDGARTPSNKPSDVSRDDGYSEVFYVGDAVELQRWIVYRTNEIYQRQKAGGTWGNWIKILTEPEILLNTNTTNTATLSENINKFKRIKIFYTDTDNFKNSVEIFNNNGSSAIFGMTNFNNNGTLYMKSARGNISGTSLTIDRQYQSVFNTNPGIAITSGTYITINKIEGYRY